MKKIYMAVGAGIVLVFLVDLILVHPHHVYFDWHGWKGFEIAFGFVGALVLMFFSLGLGEYFLWNTTCSVPFSEKDSGFGYKSAKVRTWLKKCGDKVEQGEPIIELETLRGVRFTVDAPLAGRVSKCFFDPGEEINIGETVVDMHVSKHAMHAMAHGEEGSHA